MVVALARSLAFPIAARRTLLAMEPSLPRAHPARIISQASTVQLSGADARLLKQAVDLRRAPPLGGGRNAFLPEADPSNKFDPFFLCLFARAAQGWVVWRIEVKYCAK